MANPKTKSLFLPMVKDLPAALSVKKQNDENGFWAWATREIVDSMGDVVRVDGIDLSTYHNPPETHLKILAQHLRSLPDGTAPVVARVTDYAKTVMPYMGKMVKCLGLYCEWLRDDKGAMLPLAAHYKQMKDSGGIDSVSVGMIVNECQRRMGEDGKPTDDYGLDITSSTLYETSLVTVPANAGASFVRAVSELGYGVDASLIDKNESIPSWVKMLAEKSAMEGLAGTMANLHNCLKEVHGMCKSNSERLDTLESAMVLLSTDDKSVDAEPANDGPDRTKAVNILRAEFGKILKNFS